MNHFASTFVKGGAIAALAVSSIAFLNVGFAAPAPASAAASAAALQASADHHAAMAAYYRMRMQTDEKHAISWFTQANHCDQKAEHYHHLAVLQSGTEPAILR
jgi:hypothetical protein